MTWVRYSLMRTTFASPRRRRSPSGLPAKVRPRPPIVPWIRNWAGQRTRLPGHRRPCRTDRRPSGPLAHDRLDGPWRSVMVAISTSARPWRDHLLQHPRRRARGGRNGRPSTTGHAPGAPPPPWRALCRAGWDVPSPSSAAPRARRQCPRSRRPPRPCAQASGLPLVIAWTVMADIRHVGEGGSRRRRSYRGRARALPRVRARWTRSIHG